MTKQICKSFHRVKAEDDFVSKQLQDYLEIHPDYIVKTVGYDTKHSECLKKFYNKSGDYVEDYIEEHLFVVFFVDDSDTREK